MASILAMSEILFVSVYSYFLLNEMMTGPETLGAMLVIAGVVLLVQRKQRPPAAERFAAYLGAYTLPQMPDDVTVDVRNGALVVDTSTEVTAGTFFRI